MNTLELRELNSNEIEKVSGGCGGLCILSVGLTVMAATEIVSDWDNFKRGLRGEPEK